MKALLVQIYLRIRGLYWFIPGVMVIGAIALAVLTIWLDDQLGVEWNSGIAFLTANQPEGARSVLATIAGSMITVAGVTFSMTILAVSFAGAQFGPRLIGNFMRDRGNQYTLGTLIAVFVYCLMVLRTVRSAGEGGGTAPAFVPHISILTGLLLAMAGIAVLIYFFHHVPETIDISKITAGVGRRLMKDVRSVFPAQVGLPEGGVNDRGPPPSFEHDVADITSSRTGYIRNIDMDSTMRWATEHDVALRMRYRPGDFVVDGEVLAVASPARGLSEKGIAAFRRAVTIGDERTPTQDVRFLIDELVEILGRALSSGMNDPFTALNCLDWLGAALAVASTGSVPDAERYDEQGHLRIIAAPIDFQVFASAIFDQSRPYLARDRNASLHAIRVLAEALHRSRGNDTQTEILWRHTERMAEAADEALPNEIDRQTVRDRMAALRHALAGDGIDDRFVATTDWLGGHGQRKVTQPPATRPST